MFCRKRKFILLLTVIIGLLAVVIPALAQPPDLNLGLEYAKATGLVDTDIRIIVARIINAALGLLGVVALALVLYGGYEYMTAAGNEEQIAKAKKILINAAIGLAIILSAFAITRFVISKLTDAIVGNYCAEHPADCQPVTPPCGEGECQPGVQTSFYAASAPQGILTIKNPTVSILFFGNFGFPANYQSGTVPPAAPNNIKVMKTSDQSAAPGNFSLISASRIDFNPNGSCLDNDNPDNSDSSNTCLEKNTTYQVILTTDIKSTGGRSLDCSTDHPCVGEFTTGERFDKEPPNVSLILPGNDARLPVNTNVEISANYSDDAGVKIVTFNRDGTEIRNIVLNPPQLEGTTSTLWFTGITAPAIYALTAVAADIDNHASTSLAQTVRVLPAYCFNEVKDGDETDIDCGPTCGACLGESCNSNLDCAGTYCDPTTKTCVARPVITDVNPMDGKEGNYISIFGRYFGAYSAVSSTVRFLGDEDDPADDQTATPVTCFGNKAWRDNLVVVEVPAGAVSGALQVGIDGLANLNNVLKQDKTNDDWGPNFPTSTLFIVNDTARPGLCDAQPSEQAPKQYVNVAGTNLGSSGVLKFGGSSATVGNWGNALLSNVEVPAALSAQNLTIQATVGGKQSNPIPFKVLPAAEFTGPQIDYIEPISGPVGSYVTIYGQNFGESTGQVFFGETAALPPVNCPASWSPTQIVIKAPANLAAGAVLVKVKTTLGESNSASFTVNNSSLRPGLCLIEPNNGPAGTAVTLKGEGFGASGTDGKVEYWEKVTSTFAGTWSDGTITDQVPTGAKTGKVKVWSENKKLYSNSLNFKVQNCKIDKDVICAAGTTCCDSGSCQATCPEAAGPKSSVYAWHFSTGKLPVVPRVVEQCGNFCVDDQTKSCTPNDKNESNVCPKTNKACQVVTPSPAPWLIWPGHDNVCVNANITLRFNTPINNDGLDLTEDTLKDLIFIYRCPDAACELKETNQLLSGDYVWGTWQSGNDKIVFAPKIDFPANDAPPPLDAIATSTSYQVIVTTKVKSAQGNLSANMPANPNCPDISQIKINQQAAYCFKFKTRETTTYCELGAIVIDPVTHTTSTLNNTSVDFYNLTPLAWQNLCLGLNGNDYNWSWSPPESDKNKELVYAWVSNKDILPKNNPNGKVDSIQDVTTKSKETPAGQPQLISAYWTEDKQSPKIMGKAYLTITPLKPSVIDKWPDCDEACINADIGAQFNMAMYSPRATAVTVCRIEKAGDPCPGEEALDSLSLSLGTTVLKNDTLIIDPVGDLIPNKYYRVILKGGVSGVISSNYLEIDKTSLNYNCTGAGDQKVCQDFSWTFKTKDDPNACDIDRVEMRPTAATVYWIGQTAPFWALPFGAPDICSDQGQRLRGADYNWTWSKAAVPPATLNATVTDLDLAPASSTCSANCLILPPKPQPEFCVETPPETNCCGNETIETDNNNEECELGDPGCDGKCQWAGSSYLYETPSYCGDGGDPGIGEACEPDSAKDAKVEPLQYATAVSPVDPTVGKSQYQTQIFAATTNPETLVEKQGTADFILQCGYQDVNANCPTAEDTDKGVGSNSCCYPRPIVIKLQPSVDSSVCPNTAITLKFSELMDTASFSSSTLGYYNIILAEAVSADVCPDKSFLVGREEIKPMSVWQKIVYFVRHLFGRPAQAEIFCAGGEDIDHSLESRTIKECPVGTTETGDNPTCNENNKIAKTDTSLLLKKQLAGEKTYRVIVTHPWVKSLAGVSLASQQFFEFTTRKDICKIDKIEIEPVAWWFRTLKPEEDDNPDDKDAFDTKNDIDKVFTAHAYFKSTVAGAPEQELQQLENVYSWTHHWSIDDDSIVKEGSYSTYKATSTVIVAQNKNGVTQVGASATIDASSEDQGSQYSASSTVQVFICENPWPDAVFNTDHPEFGLGYVDAEGTDDKDSAGVDLLQQGRGWTNFKLMYCRDAGKPNDISDDLPELRLPKVFYHQ